MSVRLRLTLWYSGILAVTLLIFSIVLYSVLSVQLYRDQKSQMEKITGDILSRMTVIPFSYRGQLRFSLQMPQLTDFEYSGFFIQAMDMEGNIMNPQPLGMNLDDLVKKVEQHQVFFETQKISGHTLLVYHRAITNGEQLLGILQVADVVDDINGLLKNLLVVSAILAFFVIIVAATLGYFLARKALKPIEHVIHATNLIGSGADLSRRIEHKGPQDEIGRLTGTINGMLERIQIAYLELEESDRTQRRFVSDASHELRTPLTTIRGNVDLLEKMWRDQQDESRLNQAEKMEISLDAMRDISGEAARMSRLINDLLSLARADAGHYMELRPLPLKPLIAEVSRQASLLPRNAEWRVGNLESVEHVWLNGNADYLRQLLFIFIENAFKYTERGYVEMDVIFASEQVGIRINDTGIGMDKEEIPHIFERFYRADISRGMTAGTGLGLSIAKWIIDGHHGSIEVTTRKDEGSTFVIWLPILQNMITTFGEEPYSLN